MKKCPFCQAELPDDAEKCPHCGEMMPRSSRISAGKTVFAIAALVAALILTAGAVMFTPRQGTEEPEAVSTEISYPEEEATVPPDGNPDDVTCKGTYTASDADVIAARDKVVATINGQELTIGQLQVFFWMQVRNFLTQYGEYAVYQYGLDLEKDMDTQLCLLMETPMTWQQFFLYNALDGWQGYNSLRMEAEKNGYGIPEETREILNELEASLAGTAQQYGFETVEELVHSNMGAASELEDYRNYVELYLVANGYLSSVADQIEVTDEQMEAFFQEHADGYAMSGIDKESTLVDVRHILIYPEGADGTNLNTEEFPEEAWEAGHEKAQALLDQWLEGEKTEESFAALAMEHSEDPGSKQEGGLYTDVYQGEMVTAFNDWCFDPARQYGDTEIVRTEYGYHIMYFVSSRPMWKDYVRSDILSQAMLDTLEEIEGKYPVEIHYEDILIAKAEL